MGMNWTQISMDDMTMLYLYSSFSVPNDLTSEALIRPATQLQGTVNPTIVIDAASYMESGPGRFAVGFLSSLVNEFMRDHGIFDAKFNRDLIANVNHNPVNTSGQYIFYKIDILNYLVSTGYIDLTDKDVAINISQYDYKDGIDDIALRTYIYGSTARRTDDVHSY